MAGTDFQPKPCNKLHIVFLCSLISEKPVNRTGWWSRWISIGKTEWKALWFSTFFPLHTTKRPRGRSGKLFSDFILYCQNIQMLPYSPVYFNVFIIYTVTNSVIQMRWAIKIVDNQTDVGNSFSHRALTTKNTNLGLRGIWTPEF